MTTAEKTIDLLRHLWASFDLPNELVSDNGQPFTSKEFEDFLKNITLPQTAESVDEISALISKSATLGGIFRGFLRRRSL
ncbi:hypothetical protein COCON_G00081640 [Conger conger]|uniref:Integrase catalytic domain-containing protein n=1 Tax=Conger conger TaxID=82655 RepID=A0A9Q1I2M6_CONCO|nr:hypothetical protein COCON_G00081640 [Conger conger]